jgi:methionyl aminopeptidase
MAMTVESKVDLEGLKHIGRIIGLAIKEMSKQVKPGMTTANLDEIGKEFLARFGARSAPMLEYNFPGVACISLNDEAAHGIPGERKIQPGDLVNIDLSAELDGYYADSAVTVAIPPVSPVKKKLCACSQAAMYKGIAAARAGQPLHAIGRAIQGEALRCGFSIIQDLPGHGVGRSLHEEPTVWPFFSPFAKEPLVEGLVITVEPFLTTGARRVYEAADGWTLKTSDGSLSAQYEHTIVITHGHAQVITAV